MKAVSNREMHINQLYEQYERLGYFDRIPFSSTFLDEYVFIFLWKFKDSLKKKHLKAEIWYTKGFIGIFFKFIRDKSKDREWIEWKNKNKKELLEKVNSLKEVEEISENLFLNRGLSSFEEHGFFVVRYGEKRFWHSAVAFLDAGEFMHAILIAGKESFGKGEKR